MTPQEADEVFAKIELMVKEIEFDEDLKIKDERYSIAASWVTGYIGRWLPADNQGTKL